MAKLVLIDELVVTARVPAGLAADRVDRVRRALLGRGYAAAVRAVVRELAARQPDLAAVRWSVSR